MNITKKEIERRNKFIKFAILDKYEFNLTPGQVEIVRKIAFREHKRMFVCAYTQWGKTQCVTLGIAELIEDPTVRVKVAFIGPKEEQAGLLRQYMSELIFKNKNLLQKAQINVTGEGRILKEASRKRMTFSDGSEYRVFSAEGEAERLMGFGVGIKDGVGIIVKDESCLIPAAAEAKIGRMMGNNPEDCILIDLCNPWDMSSKSFENSINPKFDVTHIDWRQGVREGRTTELFIMEQKKEITALEFEVLYESKFPEESEDSIFNLKDIKTAYTKKIRLNNPKRIISCDVADKGLDKSVIMNGLEENDVFIVENIYSEDKSENMALVGKIVDMHYTKRTDKIIIDTKDLIKIDTIGIGVGVVSRVKEVLKEEKSEIIACHFGESPSDMNIKQTETNRIRDRESTSKKKRFTNKKAEQYFRLRELFVEGRIQIPENRDLINQLMSMKWELSSSGKIKIIDPENKSPDFCFIAGTKVLTTKGSKNIEDLTIRDKIVTPYGNRKILSNSSRIVNELYCCKTNKGNHLITTGNHKIYTNETFKYIKDLSINDKLETGIIKWRLKKLFNIKERNIGFQESITTQTSMTGKEKGKRKHYIEGYGKIHTIKKFLEDMTHTILMEIPLIISLKILQFLKYTNTEEITKERKLKITGNYILNHLKKPKRKQKSGINQKKEENGIKNIISIHSQRQNITKKDVLSVIKNIKQSEKKNHSFVQEIAICNIIGPKVDMLKKGIVNIVKKSLSLINIQKQNIVQKDVLLFRGGIRVYNLEVEIDHVYYADKVLVSNSDALVYFIWKSKSDIIMNFG